MPDAKIIQDTKVIQQILSHFPEHGNQINIITIGQVNQGIEEIRVPGLEEAVDELDLLHYVETLPQPRIQNLIAKIINLAVEKFPTKQEAVKFLGMSFTSMYKYREAEKMLEDIPEIKG